MKILIAEDEVVTLTFVSRHLERWGFEVLQVRDGQAAWEALETDPDLGIAILDWEMPGMTGVEVAAKALAHGRRRSLYTILLTARDTEADLLMALEHGASAFLSKPLSLPVLRAHLKVAERLLQAEVQLADAARRMAELAEERAQLLVVSEQTARTDVLTGALNRRGFTERAEAEFSRARRYHRPLSAVCLDVDHFKRVNDRLGHHAGDQVLTELAAVLARTMRDADVLGRVGGEELTVLLPETDANAAIDVAERLRAAVEHRQMLIDGEAVRVTVSAGVTAAAPADISIENVLRRADAALLEAKHSGRNRVVQRLAAEPLATFADWQRVSSVLRLSTANAGLAAG